MLNNVNYVGRITKDPEVKFIGSDSTPVVNFGIAVQRPFKNKETEEYDVDFFNCSAFNKQAEFMGSYVSKGGLIGVSGYNTTRTYESKGGETHYVVDLRVEKVFNYEKSNKVTYNTVDEVKVAWNKAWDEKSVGLDNDAKESLKKQLAAKYQPLVDRFDDRPF